MFVIGMGFFSQHKVVASIPNARYALHYYLMREKPRKAPKKHNKKKLETPVVELPKDLTVGPVCLASSDSPDPDALLSDFLKQKTDKKRLLLVASMNAVFHILDVLKENKSKIAGVIIFDNPSNLYDYSIPIIDADHVRAGQWWKKKSLLEKDIIHVLKEYEEVKFKVKSLKKIRRKLVDAPEESPSAVLVKGEKKARGYLRLFMSDIDKLVPKAAKREEVLKSVFGYAVGVEKKTQFAKTLRLLQSKYGADRKLLKGFLKYMKSKAGKELFKVFYLHAKGNSFKSLQGDHQSLVLDDWMTLGEFVSPTETHKFFATPGSR